MNRRGQVVPSFHSGLGYLDQLRQLGLHVEGHSKPSGPRLMAASAQRRDEVIYQASHVLVIWCHPLQLVDTCRPSPPEDLCMSVSFHSETDSPDGQDVPCLASQIPVGDA